MYVVKDGHKLHNGILYSPGDCISCSPGVASALRLEVVDSGEPTPKVRKTSVKSKDTREGDTT